jgi:hypothetical protein
MKKAIQQEFPPGWNEKKVRALIAYYDNQTDEEGAAEIEAAEEAQGQTWMSVPSELVPAVARFIENHQRTRTNRKAPRRRAAPARSRKRRKATPR